MVNHLERLAEVIKKKQIKTKEKRKEKTSKQTKKKKNRNQNLNNTIKTKDQHYWDEKRPNE